MKSRLKAQIDAEFERMGVKPCMYHIRDYELGKHRKRLRMFEGIEVSVDGYPYGDSDVDICSRAVDLFRDGSIDFETDMPFKRDAWREAKLAELGLNEDGKPLRPGEKERPVTEKTLDMFGGDES